MDTEGGADDGARATITRVLLIERGKSWSACYVSEGVSKNKRNQQRSQWSGAMNAVNYELDLGSIMI